MMLVDSSKTERGAIHGHESLVKEAAFWVLVLGPLWAVGSWLSGRDRNQTPSSHTEKGEAGPLLLIHDTSKSLSSLTQFTAA